MMTKDYYVILGVSRTESTSGIREAFRELVNRYHPERVGPQGARAFQDMVAAYQVLSDPERSKLYQQGLRHAEGSAEPPPALPRPSRRASRSATTIRTGSSRLGAGPITESTACTAAVSRTAIERGRRTMRGSLSAG